MKSPLKLSDRAIEIIKERMNFILREVGYKNIPFIILEENFDIGVIRNE